MNSKINCRFLFPVTVHSLAAVFLVCTGSLAAQTTIEIGPVKDNTIFEEDDESSGLGNRLFVGVTGTFSTDTTPPAQIRRGLLAFDVAGNVPVGATITSAKLTLYMTNAPSPSSPVDIDLHRLTNDWGEEGSNSATGGGGAPAEPGDATWSQNFFGTSPWETNGGDHASTVSATMNVSSPNNFYDWSSAQLAADVQAFLENKGKNFGWIMIGDESTIQTARGFASKDHTTALIRPKLTIEYTAPALSNLEEWVAEFEVPEPVDFAADLDGDGLDATFEYGAGLDPTAANEVSEAYSIVVDRDDPASRVVASFVRDPDATDLTYRMEGSFSAEPESWFPLAESVGGAMATGDGLMSDLEIPGRAPFREVKVKQTAAFDTEDAAFVRFKVFFTP